MLVTKSGTMFTLAQILLVDLHNIWHKAALYCRKLTTHAALIREMPLFIGSAYSSELNLADSAIWGSYSIVCTRCRYIRGAVI